MKLSIIIVDYANSPDTQECLTSLKQLKWAGEQEVIVIKNSPEKNSGFAAGNNMGVAQALANNADLIMLLNNDTKVDPHLAIALLNHMNNVSADIVVPKIYFYPGQEFHYDRYKPSERGKVIWYAGGHIDWNNIMGIHEGVDEVDRGQLDQPHQIEFATGCCMMIKTEVIKKIGLFDSKYFLYLEDADFSIRAQKAGFKIYYQPTAIIWHKNAKASGGSGSSLQDYYFTRNRLLFGMRYAPLKTKFALLRESLKLLVTGTKWQKRGVKDFYLGNLDRGSFRN